MQEVPNLHKNYSSGAIIWGSVHPIEEITLLLNNIGMYSSDRSVDTSWIKFCLVLNLRYCMNFLIFWIFLRLSKTCISFPPNFSVFSNMLQSVKIMLSSVKLTKSLASKAIIRLLHSAMVKILCHETYLFDKLWKHTNILKACSLL